MDASQYFYDTELHDGVLYYTDLSPGHTGLFARSLATNDERLVSEDGFDAVADDGTLVWEEHHSHIPTEGWSLHMSRTDGSITDRIVNETWKGYSGSDVSGDTIVWGFGTQVASLDIYLYNVRDGTSKMIGREGIEPHINGNKVVWTAGGIRMVMHSPQRGTFINVYDINTGLTSTVAHTSEGWPQAIDVLDGNVLLYTAGSDQPGEEIIKNLYVRSLGR